MGFSLKSVGNLAGKALGASVGAFFGGPTGAVAGYTGANGILGAVGLGDDQLAAEQQWKYQKMASDYAHSQNLAMWNLQNAYNDPSAQMLRLKAAGLNPNLVYGGGNVSGNTAGSGPTYERPNVNYSDRSVQREQLALAMQEFRQRVTNQAIENDIARQRLLLNERDADRSDRLADAQVRAYSSLVGLRDWQQHKPGPVQQGINDVERTVGKYSQPVKNIVSKIVNKLYHTSSPAERMQYYNDLRFLENNFL